MCVYDVALWRYWPTSSFPLVQDRVRAQSSLLAVLTVMHAYKLTYVAYGAVKSSDGIYTRWEQGLSLVPDAAV